MYTFVDSCPHHPQGRAGRREASGDDMPTLLMREGFLMNAPVYFYPHRSALPDTPGEDCCTHLHTHVHYLTQVDTVVYTYPQ